MKCFFCGQELKENFDGDCGECGIPSGKSKKDTLSVIERHYNGRLKSTGLLFLALVIASFLLHKGVLTIPFLSIVMYGGYAIYLVKQKKKKLNLINNKMKDD